MGQPRPIEERFWEKVKKTSSCWLWKGCHLKAGYGSIKIGRPSREMVLAHRLSWQLHFGPVPNGKWVLHSCDCPSCVNPKHLWLGTHLDNMSDMKRKGRGCTGDKNGSRKHPERLAYGDRNGVRLYPERYPRGETCPWTKLTVESVKFIRKSLRLGRATGVELARQFNVSTSAIWRIKHRLMWKVT